MFVDKFINEELEKIVKDVYPEILNFLTIQDLADTVKYFYEFKVVFHDKSNSNDVPHFLNILLDSDLVAAVEEDEFLNKVLGDQKQFDLCLEITEALKLVSQKEYPNAKNL